MPDTSLCMFTVSHFGVWLEESAGFGGLPWNYHARLEDCNHVLLMSFVTSLATCYMFTLKCEAGLLQMVSISFLIVSAIHSRCNICSMHVFTSYIFGQNVEVWVSHNCMVCYFYLFLFSFPSPKEIKIEPAPLPRASILYTERTESTQKQRQRVIVLPLLRLFHSVGPSEWLWDGDGSLLLSWYLLFLPVQC